MSAGVVVVEAARRSGALITAARALEQGREIFAVPGPVDEPLAGGPNGLLKAGARLVEDARDVLDELADAWGPFRARPLSEPEGEGGGACDAGDDDRAGAEGSHDPVAERVLSQLSLTALGVDELAARAAAPVAEVLSALMILELSGAAERVPGGRYVLGARERGRPHRRR
jgi:DNA processing protein